MRADMESAPTVWGSVGAAAEPRASAASALGSERERIGEDVCKMKIKRIGRGGYHRDRIGGEGEARGDGSAAMKH